MVGYNVNGIVIFGEMGSGKDTFAELLHSKAPNCALYNLGSLIREFMKVADVKPNWTNRNREFGQLVSAKLREIDVNILNDYTYSLCLKSDKLPIIIGGRTKEDYEYWKAKGYMIIGVHVDYDVRLQRLESRDKDFNVSSLNHMTEQDVNYIVHNLCEKVIDNSFGLEKLKTDVDEFLNKLLV